MRINIKKLKDWRLDKMIKLKSLITEVAWFRNLRKDGSTWMMTSGPEHKPRETKIKDILNVSGNNVKLYFLKEIIMYNIKV